MKFIRKKNFLEGEELLYTPGLHWTYIVRHIVLSLPFFMVLIILWAITDIFAGGSSEWFWEIGSAFLIKTAIKTMFLAALLVILPVFIWRIFKFLCTEYGLTNKRLILKKGIIRIIVADIPVERIESIYCFQGIMGRIFNYGTIRINGIGGQTPVFFMVSHPYIFRRNIADVIEKNKIITVIHGDLPKAAPAARPKPIPREESIYRYGAFVRVMPEKGK